MDLLPWHVIIRGKEGRLIIQFPKMQTGFTYHDTKENGQFETH